MPSSLRGPFVANNPPTFDHAGWLTDVDHYVYRFSNDVFNVKDRDYGAVGDGSTNDTAAITAAITAAPATGAVLFFPPGTYSVSGITCAKNIYFVGQSPRVSSLVLRNTSNLPVIEFASGVTEAGVYRMGIDGNKANNTSPGGAGNQGVYVAAVNRVEVSRCRIINTFNDGVNILRGSGCRVCDNEITGVGQTTAAGSSAIKVFTSGAGAADDNIISGNLIDGNVTGIYLIGSAGFPLLRNQITGNIITDCTGTDPGQAQDGGIAVQAAPDTMVANNIVSGNTGRGIHVFGECAGSVIANNDVKDCGVTNQVSGIDLADSNLDYDYVVTGNRVTGAGAAGIFWSGGFRSVISNNVCINNGQDSPDVGSSNGITLNVSGSDQVEDMVVTGNLCFDNQGTTTQEYGIREWQGVAADYTNNIYANNNCRVNKTGSMSLIGATNKVSGNVGNSIDVASAATITLRADTDVFNITGTTTITSITASYAGRHVVLKFAGALTFTDGSNILLNASANFVTTANDTIALVCDGTNWYEVARSAN